MKKRRLNNYFKTGILIYIVVTLIRYLFDVPDGILGLTLGFGIGLLGIGIIHMVYDMLKIKNIKKRWIGKSTQ